MARYLVFQPDGYLEFVDVTPGGAILTTQQGVECARVVDDGNGLDVTFPPCVGRGKRHLRLGYDELDYIQTCVRAFLLAGKRKDYAAKLYELVPTEQEVQGD